MQIVAVTDPLPVGFSRAAMIGIRVEGDSEAVAEKLEGFSEVDYVVITAGSFDLLVEVVCEDDDHLLEIINQRIRAIPGVRDHRELRLPEAPQADLHLGNPMTTTPQLLRRAGPGRSRRPRREHLWMHFTRHSTYDEGAGHVPVIVARRRRLHLGRPGQALPRRARRPLHGAGRARPRASSPRPRPSRPASWRSSRCGPTRTRRRSSSPSASPHYAPGDLNRVFFTTGGGEAVESAWKLAKQYFKLTGKPAEAQGDQPSGRLPRHPAGRAVDHRHPGRQGALRAAGAGAHKVPNTNFYRAPEHARRPRGVRPLGGRPDRGGHRVRGRRHRRCRLPRAGAELRRLLPAAARATSSGCARSATSTTCCWSPTRPSAPSAGSATCSR